MFNEEIHNNKYRETSVVCQVGGNDVRLDFLTVIINIHEKMGPV